MYTNFLELVDLQARSEEINDPTLSKDNIATSSACFKDVVATSSDTRNSSKRKSEGSKR